MLLVRKSVKLTVHYPLIDSTRNKISEILVTYVNKLLALGIHNHIEPCDPHKVAYKFICAKLTKQMKILLSFGVDFTLPIQKLRADKFCMCSATKYWRKL